MLHKSDLHLSRWQKLLEKCEYHHHSGKIHSDWKGVLQHSDLFENSLKDSTLCGAEVKFWLQTNEKLNNLLLSASCSSFGWFYEASPPQWLCFCFCCFYSLYLPFYSILAEFLDDIRLLLGGGSGGGGRWYFRICWLIGPVILHFHKQELHIHNPALPYIHRVYIQAGDRTPTPLLVFVCPTLPSQVSFLVYSLCLTTLPLVSAFQLTLNLPWDALLPHHS